MDTLYLFCAVVGWLFVVFFVVSGSDTGLDLDADIDIDVDVDVDADGIGGGDLAGGLVGTLLSFLSFRNAVFFAAFFGLGGILLTWLDVAWPLTLLLAIGLGAFAAWVNIRLLAYVRRTSVDSSVRDDEVAGNIADVVLPIGPSRSGRIAVEVAGQRLYFIATPFRPNDERQYEPGERVVVVVVEAGTALVAPMESLGL